MQYSKIGEEAYGVYAPFPAHHSSGLLIDQILLQISDFMLE